MEAETVRELLATSKEGMAEVAERIELPLPIARELRVQALNLVQGKCVLCGKPTPAGMCGYCKRKTPSRPVLRTTRAKLLKKLNPNDVLLRSTCAVCNQPFDQTVGFALKMLEKFRRFDPAKTCPSCKHKKKPIKKEDVVSFRPFADSEVLKKMRPELKKKKRSRKRGKKVKKQGCVRT